MHNDCDDDMEQDTKVSHLESRLLGAMLSDISSPIHQ